MSTKRPVVDYFTPHPMTLSQNQTTQDARELFDAQRFTIVPVVDPEGVCVGVVTATDLLRRNDVPEPLGLVASAVVVSVDPTAPIAHAATVLAGANVHHAVALDLDKKPVGVLSATDVVRALADEGLAQPVDWVASKELAQIDRGATLLEAREMMEEQGLTSLPVVDGDRIVGCLTQLDLLASDAENDDRVDSVAEREVSRIARSAGISEVAGLLSESESRRMFLEDGDGTVVGIVTTTDLVRFAATLYEDSPA